MDELLKADIAVSCLQLLSTQQAWEYRVVPFEVTTDLFRLYIEKENPNSWGVQQELEMIFDKKIHLESVSSEQMIQLLQQHYRQNKHNVFESQKTRQLEDSTSCLLYTSPSPRDS